MDCGFDVATSLGRHPLLPDGPCAGRGDTSLLERLGDVLDVLGEHSAVARELKTQYEDKRLPALRSTEDTLYLLAEGHDLLGFARVGVRTILAAPAPATEATAAPGSGTSAPSGQKSGSYPSDQTSGSYNSYQGSLQKYSPCALLDFYVLGGFQRRGLGRLLFDAVLEGEGALHPAKLAYSNPSLAASAFLTKHFGLTRSRLVSCYTLFEDFFDEAPARAAPPLAPLTAAALLAQSSGSTNPPVGVEDPVGPYRKEEEEFYSERTKLYCFNAGEWQDAGAGSAMLLRSRATGRVRFVFVQEGANRVIANHFVVRREPFCDLQRHTAGNDKTWTWIAQERVEERRFALKFKTSGGAAKFGVVWDTAKTLVPETEAVDYVVVRNVGATEDSEVNSRHLKVVSLGSVVKVIEVLYASEQQRVRARLVNPPGWITILSHNAADAGSFAVRRSDLDGYTKALSPPGEGPPITRQEHAQ